MNDDLAKKDLFVPIPTIKERDIILDYLNIHGLLHLYSRFNTIQTKADYSDFLSYSDECGTWLHDSYFRYMKKVIENEMHNWIFDNRIEYATIEVPILNEDDYLPKINYVQRNLLCQRDENSIKSNMFYARASDNSVIPQKPRYLKRT